MSFPIISRDLFRAYKAAGASAQTPERLDRLIVAKSAEIDSAKNACVQGLTLVQKRFGIGVVCGVVAISLAVALPSKPTITLGVVGGVAIAILSYGFFISGKIIGLCNDERELNNFLKNVVLSTNDESKIDEIMKKKMDAVVFKNIPLPRL